MQQSKLGGIPNWGRNRAIKTNRLVYLKSPSVSTRQLKFEITGHIHFLILCKTYISVCYIFHGIEIFKKGNVIFSKTGRCASETVILSLLHSKCMPILLYAVEACPLLARQIQSIDFYINLYFYYNFSHRITQQFMNARLISAFFLEVDGGGGHWLVWMEWRPSGWSVILPLLIFPCTIKSRSSLLALAHPGGPIKRAVKWLLWWWFLLNMRYSFVLLNFCRSLLC